MKLYEVFNPDLNTNVRFKILSEQETYKLINQHKNSSQDEFTRAVLESVVYNLKTDVSSAIKKISKEESDISEQSELSESEFSEFLYDCLEKSSKLKNSKFKITNHYFSTEKDLLIKIKMNDKKETQFRILNIKV